MRILPCCRTGAVPEQRGGEPSATGSEVSHPIPSAHLEAEEGNSHFSNRMFLCPLAPDWQDLEQLPTGVRDCGRTKRGCEKLLLCLMEQAANFSHPQTSACILSDGRPKKISPPVQHHTIKIKTAGGHTAAPAKTYKPWDRPASRSLRHNVCNAAICRSQVNDLAPIFTGNAQSINYILYIPQYIVSVNIIVLLFCVFRVSVMKLSSGGKQSKRIVCVLLAY